MISVVIPALNEAKHIVAAIESAFTGGASEVIVVDGGSSDDTIAVAESAGAQTLKAKPHRARQMNAGAELTTGDVILFLHADTRLPAKFGSSVERAVFSRGVAGGAFSFAIDGEGTKYRLVEAIVAFRSRWNTLPYGDQAIFVRKTTFEGVGGFPEMPLMEDYEFIRRLKRRGRIVILPLQVNASGRRWQKLGVVRTAVLNFFIIVAYHLGVAPERLARWYRGRPQPRRDTSAPDRLAA